AGGRSLRGLWNAVGAAYAAGAPADTRALFAGRFTRPFDLDRRPRFFANPCELAPVPEAGEQGGRGAGGRNGRVREWENERSAPELSLSHSPTLPLSHSAPTGAPLPQNAAPLDVVRQLVAARVELPAETVEDGHHLLGDLHLNSISVGQLVSEAARQLGLPPPISPADYADATVAGLAQALEELARTGGGAVSREAGPPAGV